MLDLLSQIDCLITASVPHDLNPLPVDALEAPFRGFRLPSLVTLCEATQRWTIR